MYINEQMSESTVNNITSAHFYVQKYNTEAVVEIQKRKKK